MKFKTQKSTPLIQRPKTRREIRVKWDIFVILVCTYALSTPGRHYNCTILKRYQIVVWTTCKFETNVHRFLRCNATQATKAKNKERDQGKVGHFCDSNALRLVYTIPFTFFLHWMVLTLFKPKHCAFSSVFTPGDSFAMMEGGKIFRDEKILFVSLK